jgi:DNA polymerase V
MNTVQEYIDTVEPISTKRTYKAIVDCNSFYCSCERLFRPDLANKPVVVLSNNDGCIISRTDEAKRLGVEMAGPYFLMKPLIEKYGVATFSSNYNLYGDLSRRVMDTLRSIVPSVEVYSVDEAFVDLDGIDEKDIPAFALQIRHRIEQWTGIPVSVGVAPTKTLAKVANHIAKKNKLATNCVHSLRTHDDIYQALVGTRVNGIWGVGRANSEKLLELGITNAWQLREVPIHWATKHFGGVVGTRLIRELRGEPCIEMNDPLETKKMIATTRMFGDAVNSLTHIKEAVATYVARAAEKLRRQHSAASVVQVFVVPKEPVNNGRYRHGPSLSASFTLPIATSTTNDLIKPAVELATQLFENGRWYKKAGVILSGLVPENALQANLFETSGKDNRKLMHMMDNVNFSMRDDVLKFAATGTDRNWKMRQELRSGRFTSRWNELALVR